MPIATRMAGPYDDAAAPLVNDRPARRRCLVCGEDFESAGPHERICTRHDTLKRAASALPDGWDGVVLELDR
jgi:hypothetical protein